MSRFIRKMRVPHVYHGDTVKGEINQLWQLYLNNKYKLNINEIKMETEEFLTDQDR